MSAVCIPQVLIQELCARPPHQNGITILGPEARRNILTLAIFSLRDARSEHASMASVGVYNYSLRL